MNSCSKPDCTRNPVVSCTKGKFSSAKLIAKLLLWNPPELLMGKHLTSLQVTCPQQFEIFKLYLFLFCFVFFLFLFCFVFFLFFFNIPREFITL